MAWAKFNRSFLYDFRPTRGVSITIRPADEPQQYPDKIITAAVNAGAAKRVKSPTASEKRAIERAKRAG